MRITSINSARPYTNPTIKVNDTPVPGMVENADHTRTVYSALLGIGWLAGHGSGRPTDVPTP
jgi:hypothetical protein